MNYNYSKYIVSLICFLLIWLSGLPFLFEKLIPVVCENLSYNTSYKIDVEKPTVRFNITPVVFLKAENVRVQSKFSSDKIEIKDFNLKLRILPLLTGRFHINNISASDVELNADIRKQQREKQFTFSDFNTSKVICDCIDMNNIKALLSGEQNIKYEINRFYYKKNSRYLKFNIDSLIQILNKESVVRADLYLPHDNDAAKSKIDINVSDFDIAPFVKLLKMYLPENVTESSGIININANNSYLDASFKNFVIMMKDKDQSIIFPADLKIKSGLNLSKKNINFENAQIKSDNIDVAADGSILNYLDKLPQINLKIRINKSKVEDFISMSPVFKTEDIDMFKLKKYKFYGNIIGNLALSGSIFEPSMNGSIFVNNGILTKPIPEALGATIKLNFKDKMLYYDVFVPAGRTEKVYVKGNVELYNYKYADMRVWSTHNVDLAIAEEKVIPLHEILNFVIGPVPIMEVTGSGNIDITIKGNRKNPHVWGGLNFYNTSALFNEMPDLILREAEAVLNFDDENVVFSLKKGLVNGKPFSIDGKCNLSGKFDFDAKSENQNIEGLYKAIKSSTLVNDIRKMIPDFDSAAGLSSLNMKIYGELKDIKDKKFGENFFVKGSFNLNGNNFERQGVKIHNVKGIVNFDNTNADLDIAAYLGNSPLNLKAAVKKNTAEADINIQRLNLKDIAPYDDKFCQDFGGIPVDLIAKYRGRTDIIEYDKMGFYAKIPNSAKNNKIKLLSDGSIELKNNVLSVKNINGIFLGTNSNFGINMRAENINNQPILNGEVRLKDFDLSAFNSFGEYTILPKEIRELISKIKFNKGKINLNMKIANNGINTSTNIGGVEFTFVPLNLPVKVVNGSVYIRKNNLFLNKINLMADNMPVLIDGNIKNTTDKPDFDLYINLKPKQDFIDKYVNNNRIYPVKVKGDIVCRLKFKGDKNNFNAETEANLAKESSIYYLGAAVGDIENAIVLNLDMKVLQQNIIKIKEFSYDKLIDSQGKRQTRLNMLKSYGSIVFAKNDLIFQDLRVKTNHPTDARIFNIIFRKPNIKQGQFTSDLKFNGKLSNPHLTGTFHIVETNIPFMDTMMKNVSFNFKDKTIDLSSSGDVLGNDIVFKGTLRNKLTIPYCIENAELQTKMIDLNYLTNKIRTAYIDEANTLDSFSNLDLKNMIIKRLKLNTDEIKLRNLSAQNVEAVVSVSDKKVFNIDNFRFNIAKGYIDGKFSYNLLNNNMQLKLNAEKINANDISIALFDLNNQIYGDLTGNVKLACNGNDFNTCMETLNGDLSFDVNDGKMPKLGSLEYLLKAGNLLKGGLTGVSINSVIDILTPLKTGNFSNIYGKLSIKDGVTNDIEISTKGKDLSLFLAGSYNFANSQADMEVFGLLSKKISTMFGPLGNVSLNTLFNIVPGVDLSKDSKILDNINKIPAIELNSKAYRKFVAEINGNIKGENYVKSFKWIN